MSDLIGFVLRGIPFGCVYALLAVGLVVTYRSTGVFHLAFGAQAFASAAVYYDTRVRHGWPIVPAFLLAVVVVGAVLGVLFDRGLFRSLRAAPATTRLVVSLGLLVALPALVEVWFGSGPAFGPPSLSPAPNYILRFGSHALDGNEVVTIIATLAAVVVLTVLFRRTSLGLRMRAVVESPRLAELAGVDADRVTTVAWILSSWLAGLAGVLLAPLFARVAASGFTTLLVAAIAAAAFGRLASIPQAVAGGILLGVTQQVIAGYLPLNSVLAQGLRPSLPFVLLVVLLLLRPGLGARREATDPLAGVDPPPPPPPGRRRRGRPRPATVVPGLALAAIGIGVALTLDAFWLGQLTQAAIYAIIFLSITLLTGVAGQVSLCQATFAAVGAFTTAQLASRQGIPVLVGMLAGAVLAAVVGAAVSLPALRLSGIHLALATLAFALMFDSVLVPLGWVGGGVSPTRVERPSLVAGDRALLLFAVAVAAIVAAAVLLVRRGTVGLLLDALRGSEPAAAAVGVRVARTKVTAFALSAGIAGLGGGLLAVQQREANPGLFAPAFGLFWVVLVVTLGARAVDGAVAAGLALVLVPEVLRDAHLSLSYQFVLFGLAALGFSRHPEGLVPLVRRTLASVAGRAVPRTPRRAAVPAAPRRPGLRPAPVQWRAAGLEAVGLTKQFLPGCPALDHVSLALAPGELVGLIGPNGAGKTTFFDCVCGLVRPDTGQVRLAGRDVTRFPTQTRARLGLGRTFQRVELFSGMTVFEHLLVAARAAGTGTSLLRDLRNRGANPTAEERAGVESTLELLGLGGDAERRIEELGLSRARLVELGRALVTAPKVLLLDEPSSGLDRHETAALAELLAAIHADHQATILLVEHDLDLIRHLAERLYVLDAGHLIAAGPTHDVLADALVRRAYLGQVAAEPVP